MNLFEVMKSADDEVGMVEDREYICELNKDHVGKLVIDGKEMDVYASEITGKVVCSFANGTHIIKHTITLIEF